MRDIQSFSEAEDVRLDGSAEEKGSERPRAEIPVEYLAYWQRQLAGAPAILELPTGRPRPLLQTFTGAMQPIALSTNLGEALQALSRREDTTLFVTLLAAFNTLLHRYTGQDDILIGTVTTEGKTLVLRTALADNPTFRELLARVRGVTAEAIAHGELPFEQLMRETGPTRDRNYHPLFQVMFNLRPPMPAVDAGWEGRQTDSDTGAAKLDLSIELAERSEGIVGRVEYNADLLDAATIARMLGHWRTLLEGIVVDPDQRIADVPLLTPGESQQLLVEWNTTQSEYPRDSCIHELFEAQAARTPDAVAVVFEDQQLTYRELNQRANQLAHHLQALGVGPDVLVGICVERSLEMLVGLVGILKAGGAYVPLDPSYPKDRLAFVLEDTQAPVLLTTQDLAALLPEHAATMVRLDSEWDTIAQHPEDQPPRGVTSQHLAYVIYTSGSTGKPKGVRIPHRAVVNFLTSMRREPGLTAQDILLSVTTVSFDIAALEIFLPLTVGAHLVIASRAVYTDSAALARTLAYSGATVMQATPATWRLLLEGGWQGNPRLTMLCGGEALSRELADQLLARSACLWNMYGPTETTIWSTVCKIERGDGPISIGRPIANTQLYILDAHRRPVPIGVLGELYIGGHGLARGYLHRLELTAERFIPHPFWDEPDARLYRTGDVARYRPDGNVECLGRRDQQVKIRGFRIELGEIESALARHPGVRQCVVVMREDSPGDQRLAAYMVTAADSAPGVPDFRRFLQASLPNYMVPTDFISLEALPLLPNGKVNLHALPAPARAKGDQGDTFAAPRNAVEQQLARLWEEILEVRDIGIRDSFFELGGHSLLAARLVDRIERIWGKRVSLATLVGGATIEQLADMLLQPDGHDSWSPMVAIHASGSARPFFFLPGDAGLYCAHLARRLGSNQPFYVLHIRRDMGRPSRQPIEDLAAGLLKTLRPIQPAGPYLLGGFCDGGIVAFEMARQLRGQGQQVDLLVVMDAPIAENHHAFCDRLVRYWGALTGLDAARRADYSRWLRAYTVQATWVLRYRKDVLLRRALVKAWRSVEKRWPGSRRERDQARSTDHHQADEIDWTAAAAYVPPPYAGRVTLFWSSHHPVKNTDVLTAEWRKVAKDLEVHAIPGTHISCRTTHVYDLAERLRACMLKARAEELSCGI